MILADNSVKAIAPKRNTKNILRFLEELVAQNRKLGQAKQVDRESMLANGMAKVSNLVSHDFLVIVISDFVFYAPEVVNYMARLSRHNDVIAIKVFDPLEKTVPAEKIAVSDGTHQLIIPGQRPDIKQKIDTGFEEDLASFDAQLKHHRIPFITVNTVDPVEDQLKDILGHKR